jgi:hypothetical protein
MSTAMDAKRRPNHRRYLAVLRGMTPAQRAAKTFELSEFTKRLFIDGLRNRYPDLSSSELNRLAVDRLLKCHNRNY